VVYLFLCLPAEGTEKSLSVPNLSNNQPVKNPTIAIHLVNVRVRHLNRKERSQEARGVNVAPSSYMPGMKPFPNKQHTKQIIVTHFFIN
jgi:hypothetical protein